MLLSALPVELVRSIIELAAWDEVEAHPGWVANLCLVCKTFLSAAMAPLYDTVAIEDNNFDSALWTAALEDTPFLRTRRVTISAYAPGLSMAHVLEGHLARAFANAEYFAAPVFLLLPMAEHGQQLRSAMVHLTAEVADDAECDALRPLLDSCTHLHILLDLGEDESLPDVRRLLGPRTTRLVVDPMIVDNLPAEHATRMSEMLLGLPCERVLLRTLEISEEATVRQFRTLVDGIARDRRDARLWIDDSPRNPDWSIFEHDCDHARRGWALWDAGRPLYVPEDSQHTQGILGH